MSRLGNDPASNPVGPFGTQTQVEFLVHVLQIDSAVDQPAVPACRLYGRVHRGAPLFIHIRHNLLKHIASRNQAEITVTIRQERAKMRFLVKILSIIEST